MLHIPFGYTRIYLPDVLYLDVQLISNFLCLSQTRYKFVWGTFAPSRLSEERKMVRGWRSTVRAHTTSDRELKRQHN